MLMKDSSSRLRYEHLVVVGSAGSTLLAFVLLWRSAVVRAIASTLLAGTDTLTAAAVPLSRTNAMYLPSNCRRISVTTLAFIASRTSSIVVDFVAMR